MSVNPSIHGYDAEDRRQSEWRRRRLSQRTPRDPDALSAHEEMLASLEFSRLVWARPPFQRAWQAS